jgi:hypothetical protein
MSKVWKRVRVVVEVPVLGEYSEKDLAWDIQQLVGGAKLPRRPAMVGRVKTGRVEVKAMNRVMARVLKERVEARGEIARKALENFDAARLCQGSDK